MSMQESCGPAYPACATHSRACLKLKLPRDMHGMNPSLTESYAINR